MKPLDVEEFRRHLLIDKDDLDTEFVQHPSLYFRISEASVLASSRRDEAAEKLKLVDAELDGDVRDDLEKAGQKVTEAQVKASILMHKRHQEAAQQLSDLTFEASRLQALKESFAQRGYALRELASLFASEYWTKSSARAPVTRADSVAEAVQAGIREASRRSSTRKRD